MGWLLGEERSALYPAALIAAMTVKRLGLASIDPISEFWAATGSGAIRAAAMIKRNNTTVRINGLALDTPSLPRGMETPGVLAAVQHQFQAAHDGAPGHGYAEHFLVGRVRGVRHLNERMHRTVRQPCVNVPKRVRVARLSF